MEINTATWNALPNGTGALAVAHSMKLTSVVTGAADRMVRDRGTGIFAGHVPGTTVWSPPIT
ncbi:hypothetical protein [Nocardioides limicola]|uniref:hypothetical protein n=1 Tax=Nocardioides limicola TaxID=2803368 RepID=UPI00193BF322|nr:hypothetical protein [Nocardioides sp. DJM-14]